jgi:F-type H+-transporting ATPase subunit alpha
MNKIASSLRLDLAQYRELEAFAKFGSDLDKASQQQLNRGMRLVELLKQDQYEPMPVEKQIMVIYLGARGFLDKVPVSQVTRAEKEFLRFVESEHADVLSLLKKKQLLDESLDKKMNDISEQFIKNFVTE